MDTTKFVGNASASMKAISWLNPFIWVQAAIHKHPFVIAAVVFVGVALAEAFLQERYSINYACLQLTDTDVSVVYPHWLARDGSQQQAPIVFQLASCAQQDALSAAAPVSDNTVVSRWQTPTSIPLIPTVHRQPVSLLSPPAPTQPPTQTALAQPVSLVVESGLDIAVVQGLDLAQSSPFTVTLDASNPEQTLIVSYLPGLPGTGGQRSVTINGQELPIELEQFWPQWARLMLSTLFGPAGVALAAIAFFLAVLQEDRKQKELREIAELERAAEKCASNRLSTSELLTALERLVGLRKDNVSSIAQTLADYLVAAFRSDPWHVFEHSTRWQLGLQHLSSFVNKSVPSSVDNVWELLAWYDGHMLSVNGWGKAPQWNERYLIGFAWNWRWRELIISLKMNSKELSSQWQSLKSDRDFMLGVLTSQAVLEKAERAEELKRSFLKDVQYAVSRSTKNEPYDQQGNTAKERLARLDEKIDGDLWIKEEVAQEQNGKSPESIAQEIARVVTSLIHARKVGHQREKSEKSVVPFARFLWPLNDGQDTFDPNFSHEPDTIATNLDNQLLNPGSLVIFQQPKFDETRVENAKRESAKLRISLQYQLYLKLQESQPVLPVFAYLPATLVETENVEHATLLWLCRCIANEVVSYLCEEPHNRFIGFSIEKKERMAQLLAAVGYHVAAGKHCLFQPVPDADLLDVDAYYGSLLRTKSYFDELRPLLDAAKLHSTWMERPTPANMLVWTKKLLSTAGLKKALILVDNLEQPLAQGFVTAAEYAQVLAPLLANGPLLAAHQIDLIMFLPAIMKPELQWRGICFVDDINLTQWFKTELKFDTLKAAGFQFVLW